MVKTVSRAGPQNVMFTADAVARRQPDNNDEAQAIHVNQQIQSKVLSKVLLQFGNTRGTIETLALAI